MLLKKVINELRVKGSNLRFTRLKKICDNYFGKPRVEGSHNIYLTGIVSPPLINIQKGKNGKAKLYQVKQVSKVLEKLKLEDK